MVSDLLLQSGEHIIRDRLPAFLHIRGNETARAQHHPVAGAVQSGLPGARHLLEASGIAAHGHRQGQLQVMLRILLDIPENM
ncbi:hypothetical protein D3C75_1173330 [compost metagenome]